MVSANSNRAPARNLRDQSRRILQDVQGLGTIAAANVGDRADRMRARGKELLSSGRDTVERYQGEIRGYISENPFKSLLIAVGVGTIIGIALRRRW